MPAEIFVFSNRILVYEAKRRDISSHRKELFGRSPKLFGRAGSYIYRGKVGGANRG